MSRLGRDGEPLEDDDLEEWQPHEQRCRRGWLGEDEQGRPVPCPVCRPWLVKRPARRWQVAS